MTPIEICQHLGNEHIDAYYGELSGKEVRAVLKAGGTSTGVPKTAYTKAARLKAWRKRFDGELEGGNGQLALALLIEWLMRHHRQMLVDYLDFLGVTHRAGETDEDFCETNPPDKLREGATMLLSKYPAHHVATYLLLVGNLQNTRVFEQTPQLLVALGMSEADADAHVAQSVEAHGAAGAAADA
ncbi:hypothetical protein [Paraliomyxa miuraensis]|uniref:hypothetical protein n=1 Tax=Paraliomyxa miuraensis TaxID=376150 RepID=UPI00225043C0|nr:hypothetical protein [Paraliomyxa miuraensis]MCX4245733.1 hypothetical protein [Paraliomyxa miuraensis]